MKNHYYVVVDVNLLVDFATGERENLMVLVRHCQEQKMPILVSHHIMATAMHVLATKHGVARQAATQVFGELLTGLQARGLLRLEKAKEDYAALLDRARQPGGCYDPRTGEPDAEDEAVLRLVAEFSAILVTGESRENLPRTARQRGLCAYNVYDFVKEVIERKELIFA